MKRGLKLRNFIKFSKSLFYLILFTVTIICITCSCIVYFHLRALSISAHTSTPHKFNLDPIMELKLNTILPQKTKEKEALNAKFATDKTTNSKSVNVQPVPKSAPSTNIDASSTKVNDSSPPVDYSLLYPNLYAERPAIQVLPEKTAFLTFDDGPSERTAEILDILKERNIKATFFVTGKTTEFAKSMMRRIVDEGHTIAIHTYTHEFRQIYSSVPAYLDDFNNIYNLVYDVTGVKASIFRFPGGSKNGFNRCTYREFINEMTRRGFDYFDWNVSCGDAVSKTPTPVETCISNVLNNSAGLSNCVVLMHDLKQKTTTVQALPEIIKGLSEQGFKFDKLSHDINPATFSLVRPYR